MVIAGDAETVAAFLGVGQHVTHGVEPALGENVIAFDQIQVLGVLRPRPRERDASRVREAGVGRLAQDHEACALAPKSSGVIQHGRDERVGAAVVNDNDLIGQRCRVVEERLEAMPEDVRPVVREDYGEGFHDATRKPFPSG